MKGKKKATRNADVTRETLMNAAADLFARHGFSGTSTEMIAERAKANKAMINYYFGGKGGLYAEILNGILKPVSRQLRESRNKKLPADERLRNFIGLFGEMHIQHPALSAMLLRELLSGGAHLEKPMLPHFMSIFGHVREIVLQGNREGTFRSVDPVMTHLSLVGTLVFFFSTLQARERLIKTHKLPLPLPSPSAYIRHTQELFVRSLKP